MNVVVTSKEAIMEVCRQIVADRGLSALNMRTVAKECNIALGTLYNYFSDKNELLIATVESVWRDIFRIDRSCRSVLSFTDYVVRIYERVQSGAGQYPGFLTAHSVSIAKIGKGEAKSIMQRYFEQMKKEMLEILHGDRTVTQGAFSEEFTESDFIDFVLENLMLILVEKKEKLSAFIEILSRIIYK